MSVSLVLVGLMGTGKSTIAKEYAKRTGCELLDTDRIIESEVGLSVREIFAQRGENEFRAIESETLSRVLARPGAVIAAAGGVVLTQANRDALHAARANGTVKVVWLRADPRVLVERTSRGTHRPLLDNDAAGTLRSLAASREGLYHDVADLVIDTDELSIEQIVEQLISYVDRAEDGASSENSQEVKDG